MVQVVLYGRMEDKGKSCVGRNGNRKKGSLTVESKMEHELFTQAAENENNEQRNKLANFVTAVKYLFKFTFIPGDSQK